MLYVSTRNRTSSYTAHRALHEDRAPDGGLYVPFQLPLFMSEEIKRFKQRSFGQNVAYILNTFFSCKLNSWDVEFCCGRNPVQQVQLPHKLNIVETWHNTASAYTHIEQELFSKLTATTGMTIPKNGWARIAIRIAFLFAIYGETATADSGRTMDVAVNTDTFVAPIAVWYARRMGLPIGTIICGTLAHGDVWDLLQSGTMHTASQSSEMIGIERLIYFTLGPDETLRYISRRGEMRPYQLEEEQRSMLNDGFFAAVVSKERQSSVIGNFYRSHGYVLDHVAAVGFSALQDYRAYTGESKHTLILSFTNPLQNTLAMTRLLGITAEELESVVIKQRG